MPLAVVGSGVSGLVAAWLLARRHKVVLFEADNRLGGHAHTNEVTFGKEPVSVDTGFIVFNERTYPLFRHILRELGVAEQKSDMSFSASVAARGIEYNGTNLNKLFAQRSNLFKPSFWRMVRGILRFYKEARELLEPDAKEIELGAYLKQNGYSREFIDDHLVPMGAAVWSTNREQMMRFPARFLIRFFDHHGFMEVDRRPQWFTVPGGSRSYVEAIEKEFAGSILFNEAVESITRHDKGVTIRSSSGESEFDQVVIATHSDTALQLIADPTTAEREILSAIPYQRNVAQLHSDARVMPRRKLAWASWNYHVDQDAAAPPTLTYWMNLLQGLQTPEPLFVTLNREHQIDASKVHGRWVYHHPLFTPESVAAQARKHEIQGVQRTWFAGAYWGYGFHEDGAYSGVEVARALGIQFAEDVPLRPIDSLLAGTQR